MLRTPRKSNTNLDAFDMEEFDRHIAPQISLYKKLSEYFINFTNNYKNNMTAGAVRSRIRTYEKYWSDYKVNDTQIQACRNEASERNAYFTDPAYSIESV